MTHAYLVTENLCEALMYRYKDGVRRVPGSTSTSSVPDATRRLSTWRHVVAPVTPWSRASIQGVTHRPAIQTKYSYKEQVGIL